MVKLKNIIRLNEDEKQVLMEYIKPLLQQNKIFEVRLFLNEQPVHNLYVPNFTEVLYDVSPGKIQESERNIKCWLLHKLGEEKYFKDSDRVLPGEFLSCSNLISLELPSNIEIIGQHAFNSTNSLNFVKFNNGLKSIENASFEYSHIVSAQIPASVESIGEAAFGSCDYLTDVELAGDSLIRVAKPFQRCNSSLTIHVPKNKQIRGEFTPHSEDVKITYF